MRKAKTVTVDLNSLPGRFKDSDVKDLMAVNKIRSGKEVGFDYLYNKYGEYIRYYCFMKLRDRKLSEDMANEILVKVYQNLDKYEVKYTLSSWIYRITRNYIVDHIRKQKKNLTDMNRSISIQGFSSSSIDEGDEVNGVVSCEVLASDVSDPESSFTSSELRKTRVDILKKYLSKIDEQDRMILLMYYYEDMSYDEISSKLNIGLSKMKVRMLRAKKKLKEMMTGLESVVEIA